MNMVSNCYTLGNVINSYIYKKRRYSIWSVYDKTKNEYSKYLYIVVYDDLLESADHISCEEVSSFDDYAMFNDSLALKAFDIRNLPNYTHPSGLRDIYSKWNSFVTTIIKEAVSNGLIDVIDKL